MTKRKVKKKVKKFGKFKKTPISAMLSGNVPNEPKQPSAGSY